MNPTPVRGRPPADLVESATDYRYLADHLIATINPPDADNDEAEILSAAVTRIATYVRSLPCDCRNGATPCGRCDSLGLINDERIPR